MWLQKEKGGCSILWRRVDYAWPEDGSVCDVPDDLATDLLAIKGGGYNVVTAPEPELKPEGDVEKDDGEGGEGVPEGGKDDGQDDATAKVATGAAKPSRAKSAKPAA
jgi:hypothetical protein